jgi:hypothetical protein
MNRKGLPLITRIKLVLIDTKEPCLRNIRDKKPDDELIKEMKSLLEEILEYMEDGVIVKSKEYKKVRL